MRSRQPPIGLTASEISPERYARYSWAAEVVSGGRVLDAACGGGWGTAVLAESAAEVVGVDFSPPVIAAAQQNHSGPSSFEQGDLRNLPFDAGTFDYAVCFEAIAHLTDTAQALDELHRILRPGGTLLISSPNREVYPPGNPLHLSEMSSDELEEMLSARFQNVAVHRQQSYFASLLGTDELLAHDDPAGDITARLTKATGGPAGSELHAVAAATDGDLPPAPSWVVLGDCVDFEHQQKLLEEWQERAVAAEAKALALSRELKRLSG